MEWAPQVTNDSDVGRFTQFLGRLGPTTDVTLTLSGFTSGTSYTLGFDLYIIDSWDGGNTNSGDVFQVTADNVPLLLASRTNPK